MPRYPRGPFDADRERTSLDLRDRSTGHGDTESQRERNDSVSVRLRHLHETSKDAVVNHYRCLSRGHIWTVNKLNASIMMNVTPMPQRPPTGPK